MVTENFGNVKLKPTDMIGLSLRIMFNCRVTGLELGLFMFRVV